MKYLLYLLLAFTALSCNDNATQEETDIDIDFSKFPRKWVLVQMTGQMVNSTTTGANMDWQEHYILNEDNTFIKVRTRDGKETQASGTYSLLTISTENHLLLKYSAANELIGNCSGDLSEDLWLKSAGKMSSTWLQCDGPGLDYERVE